MEPRLIMAGRPIRIGDQLVLEEDYDENYIPSEHGKRPWGCCDSSVRAVVSDLIFVRLVQCSGGLRPLVELCGEPAGLCGRCTGVAVPLRV